VSAARAKPRWDAGDLIVGLYFAALSLAFWLRRAWITSRRGVRPLVAGYLYALAGALAVGGMLILADIVSAGRL
jgi:hypothetical protein